MLKEREILRVANQIYTSLNRSPSYTELDALAQQLRKTIGGYTRNKVFKLACSFRKGNEFFPQNDTIASILYKLASNYKSVEATVNLGFHLEYGLGVEQNISEAARHYLDAAAKGNTQAIKNAIEIVEAMPSTIEKLSHLLSLAEIPNIPLPNSLIDLVDDHLKDFLSTHFAKTTYNQLDIDSPQPRKFYRMAKKEFNLLLELLNIDRLQTDRWPTSKWSYRFAILHNSTCINLLYVRGILKKLISYNLSEETLLLEIAPGMSFVDYIFQMGRINELPSSKAGLSSSYLTESIEKSHSSHEVIALIRENEKFIGTEQLEEILTKIDTLPSFLEQLSCLKLLQPSKQSLSLLKKLSRSHLPSWLYETISNSLSSFETSKSSRALVIDEIYLLYLLTSHQRVKTSHWNESFWTSPLKLSRSLTPLKLIRRLECYESIEHGLIPDSVLLKPVDSDTGKNFADALYSINEGKLLSKRQHFFSSTYLSKISEDSSIEHSLFRELKAEKSLFKQYPSFLHLPTSGPNTISILEFIISKKGLNDLPNYLVKDPTLALHPLSDSSTLLDKILANSGLFQKYYVFTFTSLPQKIIDKIFTHFINDQNTTLPKILFKPEHLKRYIVYNNKPWPLILHLANAGLLPSIPKELLTDALLSFSTTNGDTPLHLASHWDNFLELKPETLPLSTHSLLNKDHQSWLDIASCHHTLPPACLVNQRDYLQKCAEVFEDSPEVIGDEIWQLKEKSGKTIFHYIAARGLLHKVPKGKLNKANLSLLDNKQRTPVDYITSLKDIAAIPLENLLDHESITPLVVEFCCRHNRLDELPLSNSVINAFSNGRSKDNAPFWKLVVEHGSLEPFHKDFFQQNILNNFDQSGDTILHYLLKNGRGSEVSSVTSEPDDLLIKDASETPALLFALSLPNVAGLPMELISTELLTKKLCDDTIANIAYKQNELRYLPEELRLSSSIYCKSLLAHQFKTNYLAADQFYQNNLKSTLSESSYSKLRSDFVKQWFKELQNEQTNPKKVELPSDEQLEAIAEQDAHIQLVARAGSGKTRTLVSRILFQIKHCKVASNNILALAFNKKAAEEVRKRLNEHLSIDELPHVMTFHSLAWHIVKPNSEILYDPQNERDEKKKFSQTIKDLISTLLREDLESELMELIRLRWESSLARIITSGLNLPEEEAIQLLERLPDKTIDGRKVQKVEHKWIGNWLLQRGLKYSYEKNYHSFGGDIYKPTFSLYDKSLLIEINLPSSTNNQARKDFWNHQKSKKFTRVVINLSDGLDRKEIIDCTSEALRTHFTIPKPLSKKQLWDAIKNKTIDEFIESVTNFITRAQKECIWPNEVEERVRLHKENAEPIQEKFWSHALTVYRLYEQHLKNNNQTDFDRLLLSASQKVGNGFTRFKGRSGDVDLGIISHISIDEFQDFSLLFGKLRTSILHQNPSIKFFVVGDDWQAINRFAGSNVKYYHEFKDEFKPCSQLQLSTNYRSKQRIVKAGNSLMLSEEPSKGAVSASTEIGTIYTSNLYGIEPASEEEKVLHSKLGDLGIAILRIAQAAGFPFHDLLTKKDVARVTKEPTAKIVILSRNNSFGTSGVYLHCSKWQKQIAKHLPEAYRPFIEFSTIHGYKGNEADSVIILEPEALPNIHPDSIFNILFDETGQDILDDERRLFYVGITRAETNLVFLNFDHTKSTPFLQNISSSSLKVSTLSSNLLLGSDALIQLYNKNGYSDTVGTRPFRDKLKENKEFIYNDSNYRWSKIVAAEQVENSRSLLALLNRYAWVKLIEEVIVEVKTDNLTYKYELNRGHFLRTDVSLSKSEKADLETLDGVLGEKELKEILEMLRLDYKLDWPNFGYEGGDQGGAVEGLLEVAWVDLKIGFALPGDDLTPFLRDGWRVVELTDKVLNEWKTIILPKFKLAPSVILRAEGITHLYHFTDTRNLECIREYGIRSHNFLENQEIEFITGGSKESIQADKNAGLDEYVHLCLTPHHPMEFMAKQRGSIKESCFLKIDTRALDVEDVLGCTEVSIVKHAEVRPIENFWKEVDWFDWKQLWNDTTITGLEGDDAQHICKAEILVPDVVSPEHILNLDKL